MNGGNERRPGWQPGRPSVGHGSARTTGQAVGLGVSIVVLVHVAFGLCSASGLDVDDFHDLAVMASFGAIVAVGAISGVAAAATASSPQRRRRAATARLWLLMTAAVGSTMVVADVLSDSPFDPRLAIYTFILVGISALLGTLLGYAAGRERRLGRR